MKWLTGRRARPRMAAVTLTVLLIFAASVAEASGNDGATTDGGPEKVIFAIADVWPWAYKDDGGTPRGSLVEVANRLSELSGVPIESRIRPVRRAVNELQSGDADFSILFNSPAQDRDAINMAPMVRFNIMLTALADTTYPLSLEALAGKKVAFIRGTYLGDAFEQSASIRKVPINHVSQALELLIRGRVAAILTSDHALYRTAEAMALPAGQLRSEKHVPGQLGTLYMSRKLQRPEVAEKFHAAIAQMSATGELKRIFSGNAGPSADDRRGRNIPGSPTE